MPATRLAHRSSLNLKQDREGIAEKLWEVIAADTTQAKPSAVGADESTAAANQTPNNKRGSLMPSPPTSANIGSLMKNGADRDVHTEREPEPAQAVPHEDVGTVAAEAETNTKTAEKAAKRAAKEAKRAAKEARKIAKAEAAADGEGSSPAPGGSDVTADAQKLQKRKATGTDDPGSKLGHGGKRLKGEPQPVIDTLTKPIKWKKIIAKELETSGGSMGLKALRKAAIAEARAHPSHTGRQKEALGEEFDQVLPTFHKFQTVDGRVALAH
jgi:hypothetical protein